MGLQWFYGPDKRDQPTEWDESPSLWVSPDAVQWKRMKLSRWLGEARHVFGVPQIAQGEGAPQLVITCLNMEKYDGGLLIIQEQQLRRWFEQAQPAQPAS